MICNSHCVISDTHTANPSRSHHTTHSCKQQRIPGILHRLATSPTNCVLLCTLCTDTTTNSPSPSGTTRCYHRHAGSHHQTASTRRRSWRRGTTSPQEAATTRSHARIRALPQRHPSTSSSWRKIPTRSEGSGQLQILRCSIHSPRRRLRFICQATPKR